MTVDSLIAEMDKALQFPGRVQRLDHADQGPHRHAVDRHPHAGRRQGHRHRSRRDGQARQADRTGPAKRFPGTSSAYAERGIGGYYLDVTPDREALARYGIMVQDVQDVIATALGGQTVTTTVEGRQRFSVNMRYPRDLRGQSAGHRQRRPGADAGGGAVPLGEVAKVAPARGPTSIRTENGQLATYIYVDIRDRDLGGYVADAQRAVQASIQFPPGYYVMWSGQYEYLERADGTAEDRRAGDAADHLPAALPELPPHHRDPDRDAVAAVRAGRRRSG